jgi:hypothetical protein
MAAHYLTHIGYAPGKAWILKSERAQVTCKVKKLPHRQKGAPFLGDHVAWNMGADINSMLHLCNLRFVLCNAIAQTRRQVLLACAPITLLIAHC